MRRILAAEPLPAAGEALTLPPSESHHLLNVIRLARGERVIVSDGAGARAEAELEAVERGPEGPLARLRLHTREAVEGLPPRVVLLGAPKPALVEEALTLGTEAGASAFVLFPAERSPPGRPREDRLARVVASAVTQCGRAVAPEVRWAEGLAAALGLVPEGALRWRCDARGGSAGAVTGPLALAVGPEGGWTDRERAQLSAAGFEGASLGPHVLRTPTAVAVALGRSWAGA
jgi:16S rRNA (uracil1498-N3)-methyltransferase